MLCEFSLMAYGARVLDCIELTILTCAHWPYKSMTMIKKIIIKFIETSFTKILI